MSSSMNNNAVLIAAAERILAKGDTYGRRIKEIQGNNGIMADKLTAGGPIEQALLAAASDQRKGDDEQDNNVNDKDVETLSFLAEQRAALKKIAHDSIVREREVQYFLGAMTEICNEAKSKAATARSAARENANNDDSANQLEEEEAVDYSAILKEKMERLRAQELQSGVSIEIDDEAHCKDIRSRLGEKEPKKRRKTGRRSRGGTEEYESEEEELEVMNTAAATQAAGGAGSGAAVFEDNSLKCPITGMLFQNPMKNKVCGHTYSQAGFDQMIKNGKRKCPIPGCANSRLEQGQLEPDVEMEVKVKRHLRKVAHEEEKRRAAQANDDEDDEFDGDGEEEFEDVGHRGSTAGVTRVH